MEIKKDKCPICKEELETYQNLYASVSYCKICGYRESKIIK